jgi:uncharacterized RDD family membrane protein YckC
MSAEASPGKAGVTDVAAWRRVVARLLDALWQVPAGILVWGVAAQLSGLHWSWLLVVTALAVSCVQILGETLLIWGLATTPGKAIMGLQVVDPETNNPPDFRIALLRAMKVTAWGMAFWLGPFTLAVVAIGLWRLSTGGKTPWERGGESTVVRAISSGVGRHLAAWLTGISIAFLACIGPLLMLTGEASTSTELSQDLRRSISGQWLWLHPLTGNTLTLDARWRLVNEYRSFRTARYEATFAYGEGTGNRVKLEVEWNSLWNGSLCSYGEFDLESIGLVIVETGRSDDEATRVACTVRGAGIIADAIVFGQARALRKGESSSVYRVLFTHTGDQASVSETVEGLANQLIAEAGLVESAGGILSRHFWRNGLTGKVAELPGNWELDRMSVTGGEIVSYIFVRRSKQYRQADKDGVLISGLPKANAPEFETAIQVGIKKLGDGDAQKIMGPTAEGDSLYTLHDKGVEGRVIVRNGKHHFWFLMWFNTESGTPPGSLEQHELLSRLLPTLL